VVSQLDDEVIGRVANSYGRHVADLHAEQV
jgi:hypothetical protein